MTALDSSPQYCRGLTFKARILGRCLSPLSTTRARSRLPTTVQQFLPLLLSSTFLVPVFIYIVPYALVLLLDDLRMVTTTESGRDGSSGWHIRPTHEVYVSFPGESDYMRLTAYTRLPVKVLYTFDDASKTNCLARWPHLVEVQTALLDERTEIGVIELRTCIQAIVSARCALTPSLIPCTQSLTIVQSGVDRENGPRFYGVCLRLFRVRNTVSRSRHAFLGVSFSFSNT